MAFLFSWWLFSYPLQPLLFVRRSNHLKKRSTSSNRCSKSHSLVPCATPGAIHLQHCPRDTRPQCRSASQACNAQTPAPKPASLGKINSSLPRKNWPEGSGREETGQATPSCSCSFRRKGKLELIWISFLSPPPSPRIQKINILCKMKNEGVARSMEEQRHENGMTE